MSEARRLEIRAFMERARRNLSTVDSLIKMADYETAVSRSYYAILYSAKAVLLSLGLNPSTHRGIYLAFGKHLVSTGRIDKGLSRVLQEAYKDRDVADYQPMPGFQRQDAQKSLRDAEKFVQVMESYLKDLGILPP